MRALAAAAALVLTIGRADASAWGCDGHRAVVFIAERLVPPATLALVRSTLAAAPTDPSLHRFCDSVPDDAIADSSTWADDYRELDAATFGWHFIDVPLSVTLTAANAQRYCAGGDCVVDAIAAQFRALRSSSDRQEQGNALRFLLHFVGDLHQPLHATTNGDRGGNCVPVTYYDRAPQQNANGDFSPNLHGVWDTSTVRTLMATHRLIDARALADWIVTAHPLPATVTAQAPTMAVATAWAQQSHALGQRVVYPRLPTPLPIEPRSAAQLASCTDNRDVAHRALAKHEIIDGRYEQASIPVIVDQLRQAAIRLAAVLKAAYATP